MKARGRLYVIGGPAHASCAARRLSGHEDLPHSGPVSPLVRRACAAGIDWALFGLIARLSFGVIDRATTQPNLFPPFQADAAWRRLWPLWLLVWVGLFVVPTVRAGATLGKRLLGLAVVGRDGEPPGVLQALARETALKWVGLAVNGAGWVAGVLRPGEALHDLLSGTQVVERGQRPVGDAPEWTPVTPPVIAAWVIGVGAVFWSLQAGGGLYALLRQGALYVPHEAGHLVVGFIMPHLVAVAAGAWGQLLFPSVALVSFAWRRSTGQLAGVLAWAGFSLLDVAAYASDAWDRVGALPVAIGDELSEAHLEAHDWWQLLSAADLLRYAGPVGQLIAALGWMSFGIAFAFLVLQQRSRA